MTSEPICGVCGERNSADDLMCRLCGQHLDGAPTELLTAPPAMSTPPAPPSVPAPVAPRSPAPQISGEPPARVVCGVCNAPLVPGSRFCPRCGAPATDLGSASLDQPTMSSLPARPGRVTDPAPVPVPQAKPRSRVGLGISSVVVLALLITGVGALLIGRSDSPSATDRREPGSSPRTASGADAHDTSSAQPAAGDASAPAEPISYTCWNDREVEHLRDCPRPKGAAGLAWVFPSFDPSGCRNMKADGGVVARVVFFECQDATPRGYPITFHYSIWRSSAAGYAHYDGGAGVHRTAGYSPAGKLVGYKWLSVARSGEFKAAVMYARAPFTVSLYAPTPAARAEALDDVLQMRPPVSIRGLPSR